MVAQHGNLGIIDAAKKPGSVPREFKGVWRLITATGHGLWGNIQGGGAAEMEAGLKVVSGLREWVTLSLWPSIVGRVLHTTRESQALHELQVIVFWHAATFEWISNMHLMSHHSFPSRSKFEAR